MPVETKPPVGRQAIEVSQLMGELADRVDENLKHALEMKRLVDWLVRAHNQERE